jgi:hypothetical protein
LNLTVRNTVKHASAVLTPSEFSRRGTIGAYGLAEDSVHVIPYGVSSTFWGSPLGRAGGPPPPPAAG